jgi:hypothetical protein
MANQGIINKQRPLRLDSPVGQIYDSWVAGTMDKNQWFQVSFLSLKDVVAIATQGRPADMWPSNHWVTAYKIQYTVDGITWLSYDYGRIFEGNSDATTIVTNQLREPLKARAIRINPISWNIYISMRAEIYILSDQ